MNEEFLDLYKKYTNDKFGKYHISYDPASESFEVEGYHDSSTIWNYEDFKYVSDYYDANPVETAEEKAARELREKAIKRNEKIDKLLGNND
jgi:hypothetical protein